MGDDAFVGRGPDLAALRKGVDGAVSGRGSLALVAGEAGIGKTALAVAVARYAVECGVESLWATCWAGDGAPAYWPCAAAVGFGGAVDHYLGVLAEALGRTDDSVRHLHDAIVLHERLSAWPWLARTRVELAAVLAARSRPADRARVGRLLAEASAAAREFGMPGLLRRIADFTLAAENVFRLEDDTWRICYAGQEIRLHKVKGLADIGALIRAEGAELAAVALAGAHVAGGAAFGADPVLDRRAQQEYRSRIARLAEDLEQSDRNHDIERSSAIADERAFLLRQLASAVGLGQRDRGLGDERERARKAVGARIKDAVGRIEAQHPALGEHLRGSISTGSACSYRPDGPVHWTT